MGIEVSSPNGFQPVEPTGLTKEKVHALGERVAAKLGYQPGEALEPIVTRLGGKIEVVPDFAHLSDTGSMEVRGEGDFTIYLSPYTGQMRDRFTIAHELGHYVLHSRLGKKRIHIAREGSGRTEWEANWFAAGFLMPAAIFRQKRGEGASDGELALFFQVSPAAVQVRKETLAG